MDKWKLINTCKLLPSAVHKREIACINHITSPLSISVCHNNNQAKSWPESSTGRALYRISRRQRSSLVKASKFQAFLSLLLKKLFSATVQYMKLHALKNLTHPVCIARLGMISRHF